MSIPRPLARQRGVSLIEVLIALVVLTIGLLGFAGLQAVSLKNNTSAYQRGLATMLAYDVTDRIRADLPNRASYRIGMEEDGAEDTQIKDWKDGVKDALPGSDAQITIDANNIVTVTIQWDDNRDRNPIQLSTQTSL